MVTYICEDCKGLQYTSNPYSESPCIYCGSEKVKVKEEIQMSTRQSDRGGRNPYILKSFITEAIKDLRRNEFVYVRTCDHVQAIKDRLESHEELTVTYMETRGYKMKLEEK